jgi:hypothetical protein
MLNKNPRSLFVLLISVQLIALNCITTQSYGQDSLIYSNPLSVSDDIKDWIMEGNGTAAFKDKWMHLFSPKSKNHHVLWCPVVFPENFIAEWEVQNQNIDAGLCIVFFAASGSNGENIFEASLPKRNGAFNNYIKGAINNYHISYYANGKDAPEREIANLRKNKGFHKVQSDYPGIAVRSTAVHKIKLVKYQGKIMMFVDDRKIIDWTDDGQQYGPILGSGNIGFRQMKWTHFAYRNFKVWRMK